MLMSPWRTISHKKYDEHRCVSNLSSRSGRVEIANHMKPPTSSRNGQISVSSSSSNSSSSARALSLRNLVSGYECHMGGFFRGCRTGLILDGYSQLDVFGTQPIG